MNDKLIYKKMIEKYWDIMERHNNHKWAINELEWLIYEVHKKEYFELNDDEKWEVDHCMEVLKMD